jgi:gas vesicle protein
MGMLVKRYKKREAGGNTFTPSMGNAVSEIGTGLIDTFDSGNEFGRQSTGSQVAKGALNMAATGFMVGGPIGAGVGALVGGVSSLLSANDQEREEKEYLQKKKMMDWENSVKKSDAMLANNPKLYLGNRNAQYFKYGGSMGALSTKFIANSKASGGNINQLSSDTAEVVGNSHDNGGVKIPNIGTEVEGKETMSGNYVFSKELGFAQIHKPIAKAKGIIETKPYTMERVNSLKRLEDKEQQLKATQEFVKQQLNLQ